MTTYEATAEGVARAEIDIAWDVATLTSPTAFYPRFGPLPAVVGVQGQSGDWSVVGLVRTLQLSDGSSVVERLTTVDRPARFAYELTDFTKLFGPLVHHANADWRFVDMAGGTGIRWTYSFTARPGAGAIVGAIVRVFWAPYMRRVLPGILAEAERQNAG